MKNFARIENKSVAEILSAVALPEYHPSLEWVEVQDGRELPQVGWLYSDGVFSPPEIDPATQREMERARILSALADLDAASVRPLRAILAAQASGGTPDAEDVARISDLAAQAQALRVELTALA